MKRLFFSLILLFSLVACGTNESAPVQEVEAEQEVTTTTMYEKGAEYDLKGDYLVAKTFESYDEAMQILVESDGNIGFVHEKFNENETTDDDVSMSEEGMTVIFGDIETHDGTAFAKVYYKGKPWLIPAEALRRK